MRLLLFTDTLGDVNGVSRFIRNAAAEARESGRDLQVVTSTNFAIPAVGGGGANIWNLPPLCAITMPGYPQLQLALPPVRKLLQLVRQRKPDVIHVSTPGPVGLAGLIAAKAMRIPVLGVYHTDFPAYVEHLFQHDSLTYFTGAYMRWFYPRLAKVFARSDAFIQPLAAAGIPPKRTVALRPGIRTQDFHPALADRARLASLCGGGDPHTVRMLSVGRISIEKNLPMLARVWREVETRLARLATDTQLVVVGGGPYEHEMRQALAGTRARFLGFRHDEELSMIYAGCDCFLFPSMTDTLGQAVMEAQASALPVVVSDKGGPRQMVRDGVTGFILDGTDERAWIEQTVRLALDKPLRQRMGAAAHDAVSIFSMKACFDHFWSVHESCLQRAPCTSLHATEV